MKDETQPAVAQQLPSVVDQLSMLIKAYQATREVVAKPEVVGPLQPLHTRVLDHRRSAGPLPERRR